MVKELSNVVTDKGCVVVISFFFFFQAEDGIRDGHVTGVQTCALPILCAVAVMIQEKAPARVPKVAANLLLLYAARALRGFGDGFAVIVLPVYLAAIGFDAAKIGLVATAALLGTAVLTLGVGLIAPRRDLRNLLIAGAVVMVGTGLAFPAFEQIGFVLAVAFFGTVNPSTGDIGVLIPIEHAALAQGAA